MARSILMRVSTERAEKVKAAADGEKRTYVAEMDRIIDAGIESLYGKTAKPKGRRRRVTAAAAR